MHKMFGPLQAALAAHDDWPTASTGTVVVEAARRLIQAQEEHDQKIAYLTKGALSHDQVEHVMRQPGEFEHR